MPHINLLIENLTLNQPVRVTQDGTAIVVIRTDSGVHAYEDVCPHAFWPLSTGEVREGTLECQGHGWEFRLEDGRCLNAPAYTLNKVTVVTDGATARLEWDRERLASASCRKNSKLLEVAVGAQNQDH